MTHLLHIKGLTVAFGGLRANDDVDLDMSEGSFVGLIGPNGAGKTTFVDAVTGFVPITAGQVDFDGRSVTKAPAHERARAGLVRTFQSLNLYEDLSVRDNLRVSAYRTPWWGAVRDMFWPSKKLPELEERIESALELTSLTDVADRMPTELSHGRRTLVGVARAIAAGPKLLILDEPAAGLDTQETEALRHRLRGLLDLGISVLLIDHDMGLVMQVCDEVHVLDFGKIIARGTPDEIRADPAVMTAYLGSSGDSVPQ